MGVFEIGEGVGSPSTQFINHAFTVWTTHFHSILLTGTAIRRTFHTLKLPYGPFKLANTLFTCSRAGPHSFSLHNLSRSIITLPASPREIKTRLSGLQTTHMLPLTCATASCNVRCRRLHALWKLKRMHSLFKSLVSRGRMVARDADYHVFGIPS